MSLNEKGLEAAAKAYAAAELTSAATLSVLNGTECLRAAITAYLSALPDASEDVVGLVERLLWADLGGKRYKRTTLDRASIEVVASAITRLAAERDEALAEVATARRERDALAAFHTDDRTALIVKAEAFKARTETAEAEAATLRKELERAKAVIAPFTYPKATVVGQIGKPSVTDVLAAREWLEGK